VGGERGLATNHVRWAGQRGNHSSTTALSPTKPPSEPPTVALEKESLCVYALSYERHSVFLVVGGAAEAAPTFNGNKN